MLWILAISPENNTLNDTFHAAFIMTPSIDLPVGLVLAAGSGRRFAPAGDSNKLLVRMTDGFLPGATVAENAVAAMCSVLDTVFAVIRLDAGADELEHRLQAIGAYILRCPVADDGMGSVLAWASAQLPRDRSLVVALGDMPWIRPETIAHVAAALAQHDLVAPVVAGRRGHPVGFGACYRAELLGLSGDSGARELLLRGPLHRLQVDDPGVLLDIDLPADLTQVGAGKH